MIKIFLCAVLLFILCILFSLFIINLNTPIVQQEDLKCYHIWCQVYHRQDIKFEDWKYLRDKNLLSGQINNYTGASY